MTKKVEKFEKPESCSMEKCNWECCCCGSKVLLIVLALLWVVAAIMACFYACKAAKTAQKSYDLNILSAWGIENFNKLNELYASNAYIQYATDSANSYISQFADYVPDDTYNEEDNSTAAGDPEEIKAIVENMLASTPVRWDANARFTIVEYTELLCPFCQRHSQEWTINSVIEQFPGEVNSVSRHFIIHGDTALQLAATMECIAELKPEVYHETFDQAFAAYPVDLATLTSIATGLWVNESALQTCIDEWRYTQAVNDMMDQAYQLFGVNGTPGNVIIDRETGNYQLISGAYPVETFVEAINSMK